MNGKKKEEGRERRRKWRAKFSPEYIFCRCVRNVRNGA